MTRLHALDSDKPPPAKPEVPSGGFHDRPSPATPGKFDPSRSKVVGAETTSTKVVYANPDGSKTAVVTPVPTRVHDSRGWHDVDNTLVSEGGAVHPRSGDGTRRLGARATSDVVTLTTPAGDIVLRHPDGTDVAPTLTGHRADYPGGLRGGRDLREELTPAGIEESVTVHDVAQHSYDVVFSLPKGVTVRAVSGTVQFQDANGKIVASFGGGTASDGASPPAHTPVTVTVVSSEPGHATLRVAIDEGWLRAPGRVLPVVIDPAVTALSAWSYVETPNSGTYGGMQVAVGTSDGTTIDRSLLRFDADYWDMANITSASLAMTAKGNDVQADAYGLGSGFDTTTTWTTQPSPDASGVVVTTYPSGSPMDLTSLVRRWAAGAPNYGLGLMAHTETAGHYASYWTTTANGGNVPTLTVYYSNTAYVPQNPTPPDGGVMVGQGTTLSTTYNDKSWFRVATGADAESGTVIDSGWVSSRSWQLPPGALTDGMTYHWHVYGMNPNDGTLYRPTYAFSFKYVAGLGSSNKTMAYDAVGPVGVNLSTGNVSLKQSSPGFPAVGGTAQLSYSYDAQAASSQGLVGAYYDDVAGNAVLSPSDPLRLRRVDPQVNFNWASAPPLGVLPHRFIVRWAGWVTVPTTGSYSFGAVSGDGVDLKVNNVDVLPNWHDQAPGAVNYGSAVSLAANTAYPIELDYYDHADSAVVQLWAKGETPEAVVPASWLTSSLPVLSPGWTLSSGASLAYRQAITAGSSVLLVDQGGATHAYTWNGSGFSAPPGETGVLAYDATGALSLRDADGTTYTFDAAGNVTSAVSAGDERHPAALVSAWSGTPARLRTLTDPVGARQITLSYGGDQTCPTSVPTGFDATYPPGSLCSVSWWDGTATTLYYASTQLARIADPGGSITDFAYTGGRLTSVRSPLAADAIAAGVRADDATARTSITYDTSGRAASVTLPAPTAGGAQPAHSYQYSAAPGSPPPLTTTVHAAGVSEPNGYFRRMVTDASGRVSTDTDVLGHQATSAWDSADRPTTGTDIHGAVNTYYYDALGRLVTAESGSQSTPSRTRYAYDEAMAGLAARYWPNSGLSGTPLAHATGVGEPTGSLDANWGASGVPEPGLPPAGWSARYDGSIHLAALGNPPQPTTYWLTLVLNGSARVWLNGQLVLDTGGDSGGPTTSTGVGFRTTYSDATLPLRIEYKAGRTGSQLSLQYTASGTGNYTPAVVPGYWLAPLYGVATTTTTEDTNSVGSAPSMITHSSYADPATGVVTASTAGVGTQNLTTSSAFATDNLLTANQASFETDTSGWLPMNSTLARSNAAAQDGSFSLAVTSQGGLPGPPPRPGREGWPWPGAPPTPPWPR